MEKLTFKQWLEMMGSTGAIYDGSKSSEDWNWQGAPGKTGVSPVFAARKPLHRRCKPAKRPSEARETAGLPFRVGEEGRWAKDWLRIF